MNETGQSSSYHFLPSAMPLVFPASPMAGESVADLVLRAAADNCYRKVGDVISAAGISYRGLPAIAAKSQGRERELSIALGVPEEDVRRTIPYPVQNRPGWSDFFGVPLRDIHRIVKHRRVSPRWLTQSLHLKAIWSVKVFSFDPRTKEQLLDMCPECHRRPTYLRTYGVQYCEFCSVLNDLGDRQGRIDFRDYPQPIIEVSDIEALDFVTGLVDPETADCTGIRGLHTELRELGRSVVFELVVALGLAITSKPSKAGRIAGRHTIDYSRFQPEILAHVGRCLLNWPRGFDVLADAVRANSADRDTSFGVQKELGPLLALVHNKNLPEALRSEIKILIRENMRSCPDALELVRHPTHRPNHDMISVQQAAAKYRVARKSLSALASRKVIASIRPVGKNKLPRLVSDAEVAKLVRQKELAVSNTEVAVRLGIERVFVTELGSSGLITPVEKPYLASRGNEYFERCSLDLLERRCREIARKDTPPESGVSIVVAARSLGVPLANPWPQIVADLLASKLQVWFAERKSVMRSLVIESKGVLESLRIRGVPTARADVIKLPLTDAAALIGTDAVKLAQLIARGFLPRDPTPQDLRSFIAEYMFTSEIQRLLERRGMKLRWREVPSLFRKSGVCPATALIAARGFVWPRRDVLAVIDQLPIAAA